MDFPRSTTYTWSGTSTPAFDIRQPIKQTSAYEQASEWLFDLIGKERDRFPGLSNPNHHTGGERRYCVLSDLHMPWVDEDRMVKAIIAAQAAGCTDLIIAGDAGDFYSISRWAKEKDVDFQWELARTRAQLELLAQSFHNVKICLGNHDGIKGKAGGRFERYVREFVPKEIQFLLKNPWKDVLIKGLEDKIEMVGVDLPWGSELQWVYVVGQDAVISHYQGPSGMQGTNVQKFYDWLREWKHVVPNFPNNPRFVLTGHTHRATEIHGYDHLLIESGMLASFEIQEYMLEANGKGAKKPGVFAWSLLVQDKDGRTDLSQSRLVRVDG